MVLYPSHVSNNDGREKQIHSNNKKTSPEDSYLHLIKTTKAKSIRQDFAENLYKGREAWGANCSFLILSRKQLITGLFFFKLPLSVA